ncbi:MAG: cell division protein FtsW [Sedimentisphaerales bacterium]|nr:cell division protein FtsW [Sedimentisphaerales bacterium]
MYPQVLTSHESAAVAAESSLGAYLTVIISALLCFGALMVFSAGASLDQQLDWRRFWEFSTLRRIAFVPLAWLVLVGVSRIDYRRRLVFARRFWLSPVVWMTALSLALLVLVLVPGLGTAKNNSLRWFTFHLGPAELTFQPSELAKWSLAMFLAAYAALRGEKIRNFAGGFLPACGVLLAVVGLIGKEDFGTAALVGAAGAMVLLVGGARWWHLVLLIPIAAAAFYVLVYCNEYRWQRVQAYWQGGQGDTQATAYQANQSLIAIGSGGLWGTGLGRGTMKLGWVPEDTTDFVFAIIAEELGFVGCALVVALFVAFLLCSMQIFRRAPDRLGRLLVVAIAGTIGAQALMNLAVVTGLAPTKGIALPFISAGGTGLVLTAMAAGVLVNVARQQGRGAGGYLADRNG